MLPFLHLWYGVIDTMHILGHFLFVLYNFHHTETTYQVNHERGTIDDYSSHGLTQFDSWMRDTSRRPNRMPYTANPAIDSDLKT